MKHLIFYFSFFSYKLLCEYIYSEYCSPVFSYMGLITNINYSSLIFTNIMFLGMLLVSPKDFKVPSTFLCNILLAFTFCPILSICWQANLPIEYSIYVSICYFLIACVLRFVKRPSSPPKFVINVKIELLLAGIVIVFFILFTIVFGFADLRALDFYNIYEVRAERNYPGIWAYLVEWTAASILPCALVFCLYYKRYNLVLILLCLRMYLYLYTGSKSTLLSIGIILLFYIIGRNKFFPEKLLLIMSSAFVFSTYIYEVFDQLILLALFPTRFIYIPALLSYRHYMFFSENPKLLFVETLIGEFINIFVPYESYLHQKSTTFIADWYGFAGDNQNTGFLGDAYDNGGLLLMIIYAVALGLILKMVDSISSKETIKIFVGILGYTMIILNDGSLLTTLLTWGLALSIFFLYLFYSNNNHITCKNSISQTNLKI